MSCTHGTRLTQRCYMCQPFKAIEASSDSWGEMPCPGCAALPLSELCLVHEHPDRHPIAFAAMANRTVANSPVVQQSALQDRVEELTAALLANAHTIEALSVPVHVVEEETERGHRTSWAYTTKAEIDLRRVLELLPDAPYPSPPDYRITTDALREVRDIIKRLGNL